jgi:predicted transcriptional regulator
MTATLHITIESTSEFFDEALADLRAVEQGDSLEDRYVLSLPDHEALERVMSAKNLELLQHIVTNEPESIRDLARAVDRDIKNVSTALNRLEELGVVEFESTGRAKRPTVWYDEVTVDIPLSTAPSNTESAKAD